jgi:hypothetical protein
MLVSIGTSCAYAFVSASAQTSVAAKKQGPRVVFIGSFGLVCEGKTPHGHRGGRTPPPSRDRQIYGIHYQQMLEYTQGGSGARGSCCWYYTMMREREYAYGPALGLQNVKRQPSRASARTVEDAKVRPARPVRRATAHSIPVLSHFHASSRCISMKRVVVAMGLHRQLIGLGRSAWWPRR